VQLLSTSFTTILHTRLKLIILSLIFVMRYAFLLLRSLKGMADTRRSARRMGIGLKRLKGLKHVHVVVKSATTRMRESVLGGGHAESELLMYLLRFIYVKPLIRYVYSFVVYYKMPSSLIPALLLQFSCAF
jgi:hypothetical protein